MVTIGKDIEKATVLLTKDELVAIPTETVYGLAANALSVAAVTKIFQVKERPEFDPLIVHVPSLEQAKVYVENIPEKAKLLAQAFWPGPLTLVLQKKSIIPDLVTAGLDTVGIRCPNHLLTQSLLQQVPFPLAAPSANPFGYVSPTTPKHVADQLGNQIDYILDGGDCMVGIESTIVGFENDEAIIYRMGGLSLEAIEKIIGTVQVRTHSTSNPLAPGQLKSHYAPRKKVVIGKMEELLQQYSIERSGILSFKDDFHGPHQQILSPTGNLAEAAQKLFAALRAFDSMPIDVILAELLPEAGLGRAINDRLRRASA